MPINREDWLRSVVPSGTVIAFAGATAPSGWLICDGSAISRSTYSALFTAIGSAHGSGDGSTTFHLPDYRGRFLRGVANGSANDPDRASRTAANAGGNTGDNVGSVQTDTSKVSLSMMRANYGGAINASYYQRITHVHHGANSPWDVENTGVNHGGNETRPKNANVNYIIKV